MKIYELLSEAPNIGPTTTTPSGIIIPQTAATPPAGTTTPPANTAPSKKVSVTGARKTVAPGAGKQTAVGQDIGNLWKDIQKKRRISATRKARVEKVWMGKYGFWLSKLMQVIGLGVSLTELYTDLEVAEEAFNEGDITVQQLESIREFLYGIFTVQVLVPVVRRVVTNVKIVTWIARALRYIVGGAGALVTGGASLAAVLATEGFFIWFQSWLGSDAGKDWIANTFLLGIVKTMGKIPEGAWSSLTNYYDRAEKGKEKSKQDLAKTDPAKAAQRDAADQAAAAKEKEIEDNSKFVGGVRVTDINGKLLPGIESNIRVKAAVQRAKANGEPDPLADIPR
jgi:hypothetical protein